jgi:hypothetical protein
MSSLTTTSINTANGSTNLTVGTGNTSGPAIVVGAGTDISIRANTTANVFIANSTAIRANAAMTVANTLSVTNTFNVTGLATLPSVNVAAISGNAVFSANVVVPTINATAFNLGTPSIATNGHSRLPNGLLIQWGTVSVNSSTGNITFPTAFAANPYSIQVTGVSTAAANMAAVTAVSTTTANVRSTSTAAASTVYYLAIGV